MRVQSVNNYALKARKYQDNEKEPQPKAPIQQSFKTLVLDERGLKYMREPERLAVAEIFRQVRTSLGQLMDSKEHDMLVRPFQLPDGSGIKVSHQRNGYGFDAWYRYNTQRFNAQTIINQLKEDFPKAGTFNLSPEKAYITDVTQPLPESFIKEWFTGSGN